MSILSSPISILSSLAEGAGARADAAIAAMAEKEQELTGVGRCRSK